jgi:hypothetical protein
MLTLLGILVVATILVVIVIILPLRPAIRDTNPRLVVAGTAYFLFLGLAFMFVEIGCYSVSRLFLGHPIYSLSIVLFSVILFSGSRLGFSSTGGTQFPNGSNNRCERSPR